MFNHQVEVFLVLALLVASATSSPTIIYNRHRQSQPRVQQVIQRREIGMPAYEVSAMTAPRIQFGGPPSPYVYNYYYRPVPISNYYLRSAPAVISTSPYTASSYVYQSPSTIVQRPIARAPLASLQTHQTRSVSIHSSSASEEQGTPSPNERPEAHQTSSTVEKVESAVATSVAVPSTTVSPTTESRAPIAASADSWSTDSSTAASPRRSPSAAVYDINETLEPM